MTVSETRPQGLRPYRQAGQAVTAPACRNDDGINLPAGQGVKQAIGVLLHPIEPDTRIISQKRIQVGAHVAAKELPTVAKRQTRTIRIAQGARAQFELGCLIDELTGFLEEGTRVGRGSCASCGPVK